MLIFLKIFLFTLIYLILFLLIVLLLLILLRSFFSVKGLFTSNCKKIELLILFFNKRVGIKIKTKFKNVVFYLKFFNLKLKIFTYNFTKKVTDSNKAKVKTKSKKDKNKKKLNIMIKFKQLSFKEQVSLIKTIFIKFLNLWRKEKITGQLKIGLANPAKTGIFYGVYCSLRKMFIKNDNFSITPDFINKKIEGEFYLGGSIRLIKILSIVIYSYKKLWKKGV